VNRKELDAFIGRPDGEELITIQPLRALSAVLDHEPRPWRTGDPVPPAWHWLYFLPLTRQSDLGADGRAARGPGLPGLEQAKRMFAGGRMKFHRPLCVGDAVARESTLVESRSKQGRQGTLVFVTTRFVYRDAQGIALEEEQDIVFRPAGSPANPPPEPVPAARWSRDFSADARLLFRFSALTFNGHRIHYDLPYAQREGYPGLVVHGPLLALLLLDLAARHATGRHVSAFSFRASAPAFAESPIALRGGPGADQSGAELGAWRDDGVAVMTAGIEFTGDERGAPLGRS
jgi:3-methylfumaryl-CoA hydratase